MKYLLVVPALFILLGPDMVQAVGLVPTDLCTGTDCSSCHLVELANRLIKWLIGIVMILFAVLAVRAGFGMVLSGGNPSALQDAKSSFVNAFVGLLIVLAAWIIVDTIMRTLVGGDGVIAGYGPWSEVQCATITNSTTTPGSLAGITEADLAAERTDLSYDCSDPGLSIAEAQAVGCLVTACTDPSCLTSCMDIRVDPTTGENFCNSGRTTTTAGPGGSVSPVAESGLQSMRAAGLNVASWNGIDGPDRTDLAHPTAVAAALWMQQEGERRFGVTPFQVTAGYTRGVGHSSGSKHYDGIAIDFDPINGISTAQVAALAREAGFTFVLDEGSHVHGDLR